MTARSANPPRLVSRRRRQREPELVQPERDFQQQVVDAATLLGWRVYHTHRSEHSPAGFPDLVLVRRPWIIIAELKREDRGPTPEQSAWLDDLAACGIETHLWRPSDWKEIERCLQRP